MNNPWPAEVLRRFAETAYNALDAPKGTPHRRVVRVLETLAAEELSRPLPETGGLERLREFCQTQPHQPLPAGAEDLLLRVLGRPVLEEWLRTRLARDDVPAVRKVLGDWLKFAGAAARDLFLSALRGRLDIARPGDEERLSRSLEKFQKEKEKHMAKFDFDTRGLPARFTDPAVGDPATGKTKGQLAQEAYVKAVSTALSETFGLDLTTKQPGGNDLINQPTLSYVIGTLLLSEAFEEAQFTFSDALSEAWTRSLQKVATQNSTAGTPLRVVAADVLRRLDAEGDAENPVSVFYQEFASVLDYIADNAKSVPFQHPNYPRQIEIGRDRYVSGPKPAESLDFLPLVAERAQDFVAEPDCVRAVATWYMGLQLERARLFWAVDKLAYWFDNGLLAVQTGPAARALDEYIWSAEDRLDARQRAAVFGRVLGTPGTDVPKDVRPNAAFESALRHTIATIAEIDREQRVSDLFVGLRGASPASSSYEMLRKSGRELLSIASLYGYAGTQANARRLKQHIAQALEILDLQQIRALHDGALNAFQTIESVLQKAHQPAANVVKYRTMAEAGARILHVLARNIPAFSSGSQRPLLTLSGIPGDISSGDTQLLINDSNSWLAVNNIAPDQTEKIARPVETPYTPSIPVAGAGPGNGDLVGKLQEMVKSGSAPSLDQLQKLLPSFN